MDEIKYMVKPDWVSWDDVCECIRKANVVNDKNGFHMLFADIQPSELEEELRDGKCFVALLNSQVIGTASFKIRNLRKWYRWGKVIYFSYDGILPEYRGTDVYFNLCKLKDKYVRETRIRTYQFHTAEKNKTVIKINLKYGFKKVLFRPTWKNSNYYSVTMVKWEDGCPFPDWFIKFMFNSSMFITKTFFTTDGRLKFWNN